jgi:ABC-type amino acid transport substrate-binding protein
MRAHLAGLCVVFSLAQCVLAAGENRPSTHEEILQELLKSVDALTSIMKGIGNEADVAAAKDKLSGILRRGAALVDDMDNLGQPEAEKAAQLAKKHREKMVKAAGDLVAQYQRLAEVEAFKEVTNTPDFQELAEAVFDWTVQPIRGDPKGANHLLGIEETPDRRPVLQFDHTAPFRLELGRGSGWQGLETVAVNEKGEVLLYKMAQNDRWQTAKMSLPVEALAFLAKSVADLKILAMGRMYSVTGVADGTQWVFWLKQGEHEKSIYFNNHFPEAIQDFAVFLDELLAKNELGKATWTDVPAGEERKHEKAIWASVRKPIP